MRRAPAASVRRATHAPPAGQASSRTNTATYRPTAPAARPPRRPGVARATATGSAPSNESIVARIRPRARCSSTRWFSALIASSVHASSASHCSMSRRISTARWAAGNRSIACRHVVPKLAPADDALRADLVPQPRRFHPVPVRLEGRQRHRPLPRLAAICHIRQPNRAGLAAGPRPGAVQHDAEHPGDEAGAPLEPVDPGMHREPGVLHHLLALRMAADDRGGHADQRTVEPADQPLIRALVTLPQPGQESRIVEFAAVPATHAHDGRWPFLASLADSS